MKRLNYILVIIAIISVICAISLFNKEGYAINISSKNKELIKETLNGEIDNTDNITKIILGQGWNSGKLTIYHSFGKKETLYITEGMFKLGELEKYIKENGHNLDDIGFVLIGISSLITLYLLGYKYINKNKAKR
ncbi:MAG: hypothetical protein HFJ26_00965 [Clostridia bacterium]|nr:hypothetical protein [Clostridia bacterium]